MKIKQSLLEYLVRECIREVMTQVKEVGGETVGAPAPPADGTGSGENLGIPNEDPSIPDMSALKGIVIVNPKNKSNLRKVSLQPQIGDRAFERSLKQVASAMGGGNVEVAEITLDAVKETLRNPNSTIYLYFGKFDPKSREIYLIADKSLQIAKDSSVPPVEVGTPITPTSVMQPTPMGVEPEQVPNQVPIGEVRKLIKKMVNELLVRK